MNTSAVKNYARDGAFSVITALGFCVYNAVLGLSKSYSFALCMAIYYFLLTAIRIGIAAGAIITRKNEEEGSEKIEKLCVCSSWLLIALNVALIAPIIMLVRQERNFSLGIIPAITTAAYCTYKTTAAIVRYVRKGERSPLDRTRNSVALVDAATSVLILQNTLIMATGSGGSGDMHTLTIYTSFFIYAFIVFASVMLLVRLKKNDANAKSKA